MIHNTLFVGAGPANIMAAHTMAMLGNKDFLLVESGNPIDKRDRYDPVDCVHGEGGAGLFSDGKFSFYPSGTKIWQLGQMGALKVAYSFVSTLNSEFPDFPDLTAKAKKETEADAKPKDSWSIKNYPSIYLPLKTRKDLISELTASYYDNIRFNTEALNIEKEDDHYIVTCRTTDPDTGTSDICTHHAYYLVLAGGRFMPVWLYKIPFILSHFRRVELGIRVEGPAMSKLYNISTNIDPKFTKQEGDYLVKTFCWCRNGETVCSKFKMGNASINTYSGRSDFHDTEDSNFGFNIVIKEMSGLKMLNDAFRTEPFSVKYSDAEFDVPKSYAKTFQLLKRELDDFFDTHDIGSKERDELTIKGPTIEGVGMYPVLDSNLKVEDENIYVCGDASGLFRGIIASMISGAYVAFHLWKLDTTSD